MATKHKVLRIKVLNKKVEKILEGLIELKLVEVVKDEPQKKIAEKPVEKPKSQPVEVQTNPADAIRRHETAASILHRYNGDSPTLKTMKDMRSIIDNMRGKKS